MGMLVDRTLTRWAKFRPDLLRTPVPIALSVVGYVPNVAQSAAALDCIFLRIQRVLGNRLFVWQAVSHQIVR